MTSTSPRRRVHVFCLTYGEPHENEFAPQFEYSLKILNRLTRRVAPIPRFVTPLLAARRARMRCANFRAQNWNSPLEAISEQQTAILGELLREMRPDCDFTMELIREFRAPLLPERLNALAANPPDDIIVIPLYVAESDFTTGISRTDFETWHRANPGHELPPPRYAVGFGFDERFADALADFIWAHCERAGWTPEQARQSALILGAHGTVVTLPPGMNSGAQETGNLFRLIRRRLMDRFGWVRVAWLNHKLGGMWTCPSAEVSAHEAQEKGFHSVVYFPFGFVGDNGESMLEGKIALANFQWERLLHLPCPNDDRTVLSVMARIAAERLNQPPEAWATIGAGSARYERPEMPAPPGQPGFLRFPSRSLALFAGLFWLAVGVMLTARGVDSASRVDSPWSLAFVAVFGLVIAWYKGRRILGKLALKNLKRLRGLPQPSPLLHMFGRASWIMIAFFASLGMSLRFVPMPDALRAGILLGVGGAMLVGASYYFLQLPTAEPLEPAFPSQSPHSGDAPAAPPSAALESPV